MSELCVLSMSVDWGMANSPPLLAQANAGQGFLSSFTGTIGEFLPGLIGAVVAIIVGWLIANIAAAAIRAILKKTEFDNKIANALTGQPGSTDSPPVEQWASTAVFWIVMLFAIIAALRALNLEFVSTPLQGFLDQIFVYLPKVGGAALLLGVAWLLATAVKLFVTKALGQFQLDDKLAASSGDGSSSPIPLNETLGNVLFWLILFFFLPAVLGTLELQGPLAPVENLLDDILAALPNIFKAAIIIGIGWFVSRIVRGVVSNLLAATGVVDAAGERIGLRGELKLSGIIGTFLYGLILLYSALEALKALALNAITDPIVEMLENIYEFVPLLAAAGAILGVSFFLGRIISNFIAEFLASVGFNNVYSWLGLPELSLPALPSGDGDTAPSQKTPSELVGLVVLAAVMFFAAVAATEALQLSALTDVIRATFRITARVFSGVIVFAIGLYFANLVHRLVTSTGSAQASILGQTARIAILAFVGAMALQQMGVATNIVNLAFGLLLGAIAVAIAIAFGLGGREVASEQVREWLNAFKGGN